MDGRIDFLRELQRLESGDFSREQNETQTIMNLVKVGEEVGTQALEGVSDLLSHPNTEVKIRAATVFSYLSDRVESNRDRYDRHKHDLAPRTVDQLILALTSMDGRFRQLFAEALGVPGNSRAVEPLIAGLRDEDRDLRVAAMTSLGVIRDSRAVKPLIAALRRERGDPYAQRFAAEALGRLGDRRAVKPLLAVFRDDGHSSRVDPDLSERLSVRAAALHALGAIRDSRAVKPLIAALRSRWLRGTVLGCHVLRTLAEIGDPRAVDPLIAALHDPNWDRTRPNSSAEIRDGMDPYRIEGRAAAATALARMWPSSRRRCADGRSEASSRGSTTLRSRGSQEH